MNTRFRRLCAVAVSTASLAAVAIGTVTWSGPAAAAVTPVAGYVWADQPTTSSYVPNPTYSFNSTGGTNTIIRDHTGGYTVNFPGLSTIKSGTVDVSPYGTPGFCTLNGWASDGAGGENVSVQCDSPLAVAQDMRFTLAYVVDSGRSTLAYAFADHPATRNYTPDRAAQYDGFGGTLTVHRSGTGTYQVTVPNGAGPGGTAKVSSISLAGVCHAVGWAPAGADEVVDVSCASFGGAPQDTPFTVSFARNTNLLGRSPLEQAYARANRPTLANYTPLPIDQFASPNGGALNAHRTAPGTYSIHIPGQALTGGDVQVTAFGSLAYCDVAGWFANGAGGETVNVQCVDHTGTSVDSQYVMQWVAM